MNLPAERLYELLPAVHRERDAAQGYPLRDLLGVIDEQVAVVADDVARLYDNWFIETCEDWVVPYLGDLVGYTPVPASSLIPRREVANTLRYRRRKGTLALLELLARDVAGWPARAVELSRGVAKTVPVSHLGCRFPPLLGPGTMDLRNSLALERLDTAFDPFAHLLDVRRLASARTPGRWGLNAVGLFVWRTRPVSVTQAPAYCAEENRDSAFTFSALGNDVALLTRPVPEGPEDALATPLELPLPITRRALAVDLPAYYGPGRSFQIERVSPPSRTKGGGRTYTPIPAEQLLVADLAGWRFTPPKGRVAVDPERGRIAFHPREAPRHGVRVSYHEPAAELGASETPRRVSQARGAVVFRVGAAEEFHEIAAAVAAWQATAGGQPGVVEITDSGAYTEPLAIELAPGQSLQLRAASGCRPLLRLLNWETSAPDAFFVLGAPGAELVLDGLLVAGRSVTVQGPLARLALRHVTLVPGWGLCPDGTPRRPAEPSLELCDLTGCVTIDRSVLGPIQVTTTCELPLLELTLRDSILDAADPNHEALSAPGGGVAATRLTVQRTTVYGKVITTRLELGENSLFVGELEVCDRATGCLRFSWVAPGSRTPRRHHGLPVPAEDPSAPGPRFVSTRLGHAGYFRLTGPTAEAIRTGAERGSEQGELGAHHDLFEPQRAANLATRLTEFTPAGLDAGLIFAS